MESGPSPFGPEMGAEFLQPPVDLLQAYGDREVTMFGMTGTLDNLAGMCPVDLTDPSKIDAVNTFVAKAANEAGLEVEPEHEALFAKVIEEAGLEQKFKVAERPRTTTETPFKEPQPVKETTKETATDANTAKKDKSEWVAKEAPSATTEQPFERVAQEEVSPAPAASAVLRLIEYGAKEHDIILQPPAMHIEQPRLEQLHRQTTASTLLTAEQLPNQQMPPEQLLPEELPPEPSGPISELAPDLPQITSLTELFMPAELIPNETTLERQPYEASEEMFDAPALPLETLPETPAEASPANSLEIPLENQIETPLETQLNVAFAEMSEFIDIVTPELSNPPEGTEQVAVAETMTPAMAWAELLMQPPVERSTEFAVALSDLAVVIDIAHEPAAAEIPAETEAGQQETSAPKPELTIELAEVLQLVSDRIIERQDNEAVAISIKNIVGAVHGIHLLKEQQKDEASIQLVEQQLEAYVVELFEQLGMEPNERAIKLFTLSLLQRQSAPKIIKKTRDILERDELGTYESKYASLYYNDPLNAVADGLHQFLGKMATYYAQTHEASALSATT